MITVSSPATSSDAPHCYRLGGHRILFSSKVTTLAEFEEEAPVRDRGLISDGLIGLLPANSQLQYAGAAPFAGRSREVSVWRCEQRYQIDIDGEPSCLVDLLNQHVHLLRAGTFDESLNLELVTGPALMLILAAQQTYTLHAGAVATERGALAFMAESGTGKSTLSADAGPRWPQVADDMLPLSINPANTEKFLLHSYPQLKLNNAVAPQAIAEAMQLRALLRLSNKKVAEVSLRRLARTEAMLEVIKHSVATKLFDNQTMHQHAQFAQTLSASVPVFELAYPRDLSQLSALRETILLKVHELT